MHNKIKIPITVVLGGTMKTLDDVLNAGEGTVLELDKLAGEPVDVYAGTNIIPENLIAKGEVVIIDENFGVRLTEIIESN